MFSRCYATISDLILDFTGIHFPLPIFSYGFFVALGFLAAAVILSFELKRRERLGLLQARTVQVEKGKPATPYELIFNALIGFVLGFKLVFIAMNYTEFAARPQELLVSGDGSLIGGVLGAALLAFFKFNEKNKEKADQPYTEEITIHPHENVGDFVIVAAISGVLGAKLFYLFETPGNLEEFLRNPLDSFFGGLTIYGGLLAGIVATLWYGKKKKGIAPLQLADATAPALFLAYAFGRMGCSVSGDGDWGVANTATKPGWLSWWPDRWWSFDYPHNIINEGVRIPDCAEAHCYVLPEGVYPTPIYEILMSITLFLVLWSLRKYIKAPGVIFMLYIMLNGVERFAIEQVRINTKLDFLGLRLTQAEIIAMVFVLVGIAGMAFFAMKYRRKLPSSPT